MLMPCLEPFPSAMGPSQDKQRIVADTDIFHSITVSNVQNMQYLTPAYTNIGILMVMSGFLSLAPPILS